MVHERATEQSLFVKGGSSWTPAQRTQTVETPLPHCALTLYPPAQFSHSRAFFVLIFNPLSSHFLQHPPLIRSCVSAPLLFVMFKIQVQINSHSQVSAVCRHLVEASELSVKVNLSLSYFIYFLMSTSSWWRLCDTKIRNSDEILTIFNFLLLCVFCQVTSRIKE